MAEADLELEFNSRPLMPRFVEIPTLEIKTVLFILGGEMVSSLF